MMKRPDGAPTGPKDATAHAYTVEQRDAALLAVVLNGGRVHQAARDLDVSAETLRSWMQRHRARYEELQQKHGPELEAKAVANLQGFIVRSEEAKSVALDATVVHLESGEAKNPGNDLKNIAIAQGIAVQKVLELTARPTSIVEHRSIAEAIERMRALGGEITMPGYDIDATVVESPQLPAGEPIDTTVADAPTSDS